MMFHRGVGTIVAVALTLGLSACNSTDPDQGPPVVADLECGEPGAPASACTLPIAQPTTEFEVVLVSKSCTAQGNTISVVSPVARELTDNACYEDVGETWNFDGPFAAGTVLDFRINSFGFANPPSLLATGTYPNWTLTFEDGGDQDFNDIILRVTATPAD